ncbi:MAG: four helix bundle protein [Firmicutes bacterium]|nr:four helix bundle protein [Bacillota bacterium]
MNSSIEFSTKIIEPTRKLKENRESIISNQIGRSGTSIGANIHELAAYRFTFHVSRLSPQGKLPAGPVDIRAAFFSHCNR